MISELCQYPLLYLRCSFSMNSFSYCQTDLCGMRGTNRVMGFSVHLAECTERFSNRKSFENSATTSFHSKTISFSLLIATKDCWKTLEFTFIIYVFEHLRKSFPKSILKSITGFENSKSFKFAFTVDRKFVDAKDDILCYGKSFEDVWCQLYLFLILVMTFACPGLQFHISRTTHVLTVLSHNSFTQSVHVKHSDNDNTSLCSNSRTGVIINRSNLIRIKNVWFYALLTGEFSQEKGYLVIHFMSVIVLNK